MGNENERKPTQRVVLRRERVLALPDGVRIEELVAAKDERAMMKLLGLRVGDDPYGEAWVPVGEFEGASMTKAIEAYAGKPGTPDAIPGAYKAPTVSAWAGGEEYVKPPAPKVERRPLR